MISAVAFEALEQGRSPPLLRMMAHACPACNKVCKSWSGVLRHWEKTHQWDLGDIGPFLEVGADGETSRAGTTAAVGLSDEDVMAASDAICAAAMDRLDAAKFQCFESDASGQRAKSVARDAVAAMKPFLVKAIEPHLHEGVEAGQLIEPIMSALDRISSVKRERAFRQATEKAAGIPPLKVYPRTLGIRPQTTSASTSRRALRTKTTDTAEIWETRLEEVRLCQHTTTTAAATLPRVVHTPPPLLQDHSGAQVLEREMAYDPGLVRQIIEADVSWTQKNKTRTAERAPDRKFEDTCDGQVRPSTTAPSHAQGSGDARRTPPTARPCSLAPFTDSLVWPQMWRDHPFLGDPNYSGPVRLAFEGYSDDVDAPNPLGLAAGHHKLFLSFTVLLNRPAGERLNKVSINLAACALSSDVRLFSVEKVMSGPVDEPYQSTSFAANFRRFHDGVTLKTPLESGLHELSCRGWCFVYIGDGVAMGELCGTNTSFSAAHNICNTCEDALQNDTANMRKPNGFLECTCTDDCLDANAKLTHVAGCCCNFRLRTPARDAARRARAPNKAEQQRLGITTEAHAFVRVPFVLVSCPGPKDVMHTFLEGITRHLAAYTLIMLVAVGWGSESEVRKAISCHKYATRDGLSRPGFLPKKLFVMTKVKVPARDGKPAVTVWGPHKDAKLPYSAYQNLIYTIHSLEILRKFVPRDSPLPTWWMVWVVHVAIVGQMMRFSFTYADLQLLEKTNLKWQELYYSVPEYYDTWRPKVHWSTHLAHDIFLWGPVRLLWAMIMEMKNREFKLACKRSNYFNPVKSVCEFWVDQSAHQLKKRKHVAICVSTSAKSVGYSGLISRITHAPEVRMLLSCVPQLVAAQVEYISEVKVHGVCFERNEYCLDGSGLLVCKVVHIMRVGGEDGDHYTYLQETGVLVTADEMGVLHCKMSALESASASFHLVSMSHANVSAMWHYSSRVNDEMHFYPKW